MAVFLYMICLKFLMSCQSTMLLVLNYWALMCSYAYNIWCQVSVFLACLNKYFCDIRTVQKDIFAEKQGKNERVL